MVPDSKRCSKCDVIKPLSEFSRAPRGKWGRKSSCKACDAAWHKAQFVPTPRDEAAWEARYTKQRGDTKVCTQCGETKPLSEFGKSRDGKYGPVLRPTCKVCNSERAMRWHVDNPGRMVSNRRKRLLADLYGLTPEKYDAMLRAQGGVCAVCGKAPRRAHVRDMRLTVDHCHKGGHVRGLLCSRCNRAIGLFGDDPVLMRKAISYLLRNQKGAAIPGGQ